jgi:hypothetical protein
VIATNMSNFARTDEGKTFVLGMQALKRIGRPATSRPGSRVPRFRRRTLDHRRHHPRRRGSRL